MTMGTKARLTLAMTGVATLIAVAACSPDVTPPQPPPATSTPPATAQVHGFVPLVTVGTWAAADRADQTSVSVHIAGAVGYAGWGTRQSAYLAAYQLATARPLWPAQALCAKGGVTDIAVTETAILALVSDDVTKTLCVRSLAGTALWQAPVGLTDWAFVFADATVVIGSSGYDLQTGVRRWTLPAFGPTQPTGVSAPGISARPNSVAAFADRRMFVRRPGAVEQVDTTSGTVTARLELPADWPIPYGVVATPDFVAAVAGTDLGAKIATLTPTGPKVRYETAGAILRFIPCGQNALCLVERPRLDAPRVFKLDLVTGTEVWRSAGSGFFPALSTSGAYLAVSTGRDGSMILTGNGSRVRLNSQPALIAFTDPRRALLIGNATGGVRVTDPAVPVIGLDLVTGTLTTLGQLDSSSCDWNDQYLLCWGDTGTITRFAD